MSIVCHYKQTCVCNAGQSGLMGGWNLKATTNKFLLREYINTCTNIHFLQHFLSSIISVFMFQPHHLDIVNESYMHKVPKGRHKT